MIRREEGRTRSSTGIHTCVKIVLRIIIVIIIVVIIVIIMVIVMFEMIDHTYAVHMCTPHQELRSKKRVVEDLAQVRLQVPSSTALVPAHDLS